MFCKNCGGKLEGDSVFCPSCGAKVVDEGASTSGYQGSGASSFDFGKVFGDIGKFIVALVKKPMDTMGNVKTMDNNLALVLGGLLALVTSIGALIVKGVVFGSMAKSMGPYGSLMGVDAFKGLNGKIFFGVFINNLLYLAAGALIIFLVVKFLFKREEFSYLDGGKIVVGAFTYAVILMAVGVILSIISVNLGVMVMSIGGVVNFVLVLKGITSFGVCDENKALYVSCATLLVTTGVQYLVLSSILKSVMKSFIGGIF